MVFDGVVGPPTQILGDLRPPVPKIFVGQVEQPFLVAAPLLLFDARI